MKKIMSVLLTICMAASLFAGLGVSAQAGEVVKYGVTIAGDEFTDETQGMTIACGSGTATLDITTTPYTLTLHNATIECRDEGIVSEAPLNIVLEGINTVTSAEKDAIILRGSTTIREAPSGGFLLATASDAKTAIYLQGRNVDSPSDTMTIESGYVAAFNEGDSSGQGIFYDNWLTIEVTGGTLLASGGKRAVSKYSDEPGIISFSGTKEVLAGAGEEEAELQENAASPFSVGTNKYISISDTPHWNFDADISWYDDEKIEFTLTTAEELAGLAKLVNEGKDFYEKTIILGADIDLSGKLWTPIGNENYFGGTFNGGKKAISGLTVLDTTGETNSIGLFGSTAGAQIWDTALSGSITLCVPHGYAGDQFSLGMIGNADVTHIENCRSSVNISVTSQKENLIFYAGGIAGQLKGEDAKTIVGCSNSGNITVTAKSGGSAYVGGLAGLLQNDRIYNSFNTGSVSAANANALCVGGLVGQMKYPYIPTYIANCYNRGAVTGGGASEETHIGGVGGEIVSGSVRNCYSYINSADAGEYWVAGNGQGNLGYRLTADEIKAKLAELNEWVEAPGITLGEGDTEYAEWFTSSLNDGLPCFEKKAVVYLPSLPKAEPVIVDGTKYDIGTKTETTTTTTVTVDDAKLRQQIESANESVVVPITSDKKTATAQLMVKNVEDMAKKEMTLSVQTGGVTYQLPTTAVDTASVMEKLGAPDSAKVPVSVTITNLEQNAVTVKNGELMLQPVKFTVTADYDGKTVEIERFSQYVRRIIEIPEGTDASKITTALRVEDGEHVPTNVFQKDGKWYAIVNSRTNSTYALVYNEESFGDAAGKWYEETVNEMASRCVIFGRDTGDFDGVAPISRAEFASIVIRALGLPEAEKAAFSDVTAADWFYGAVGAAGEYGLINGRGSGIFDPTANITREEAMAMLARAAKIAEYTGKTGALDAFSDGASVSEWARDAASFSVGSGLIIGDSGALRPTDSITRAETATAVLRLLQKAELVDLRAGA